MLKLLLVPFCLFTISTAFGQKLTSKELVGTWNAYSPGEGKMSFQFINTKNIKMQGQRGSTPAVISLGTYEVKNDDSFSILSVTLENSGLKQVTTWLVRRVEANTLKFQFADQIPYRWIEENGMNTMIFTRCQVHMKPGSKLPT